LITKLDDQWISLLSGAHFNYNKPEESDVTINDIASALSNICRFAGHLPRFYSVAQHLVNASYIVSPENAFTALMHDTAEAFTNDLPTPLKWAFPIFKDLEIKTESAMSEKFGFAYPYPDEVKEADTIMLMLEKYYVKLCDDPWPMYEKYSREYVEPYHNRVDLSSWRPSIARNKFLSRFEELSNVRNAVVRYETEAGAEAA
jgi:uncharacterized protein